jgi:hypothetical protein
MNEKAKPIFAKRIFWDVNFEQIDYNAKANWVIERVFHAAMWRISASAAGSMVMIK